MTDKPMLEIDTLDNILWSCLNLWDCYARDPYANVSEKEREDLKCMDPIDWFCGNIKNRLEVLKMQEEYSKLFNPVLCYR